MPYKDPEKRKAYNTAYHNTPEQSEKNKAYQRQYRKDNPESIRETKRRNAKVHKDEIAAYQKNYRQVNAPILKVKQHETYLEHRDERLTWQKGYDSEHIERKHTRNNNYRAEHRDSLNAYLRVYGPNYQRDMKEKILTYYGEGALACIWCDYDDIRALSIDHINGGGNKHRKDNNITHFYNWLQKEGLPEGYRTLCSNCQHLALLNGRELKLSYIKLKTDVFQHYCEGDIICSRCKCPDIKVLTLDHMNSDGNEHRRREKITSGEPTYRWIKKNNYPKGFQVLCYNCNTIKKFEANEFRHNKENE